MVKKWGEKRLTCFLCGRDLSGHGTKAVIPRYILEMAHYEPLPDSKAVSVCKNPYQCDKRQWRFKLAQLWG